MAHETSFLDLPPEIRNEIYALAIGQPKIIQLSDNVPSRRTLSKPYFHGEPALLAVNRQIRSEATAVFYGVNTFQAPYSAAAGIFLDQLGPQRCAMLRNLRAFNGVVATMERDREDWLNVVWSAACRLVRECDARLHKDALVVPIRERGGLSWKRLNQIEEFTVVGIEYAWHLEWK